ncbi:hypothetical protein BDB01DRAFT_903471 [Pilobolus umbonatus]|nr:hypothetical protein BDB01DRAFT_903471 [Pilobolus umbonatus]
MAPIDHFKAAFWSQKQPEMTLPDFQTGYNILHNKLSQSKIENEEIITYMKDRISIEEMYANKLSEQGKIIIKPTGFGRDDGASLKTCFLQLKKTSTQFGEQHRRTASHMSTSALKPLQEFHEEYKTSISNSKQAIDSILKQFDGLVKDTQKARTIYRKRCKEADRAEELALKSSQSTPSSTVSSPIHEKSPSLNDSSFDGESNSSITLQLGNQIMTQGELNQLVKRMKDEIEQKDHRVSFLGTYKNTSSGENITRWLQSNLLQCKDSPAMADIVGQQLIQPYGVLRLIGQRGNKFTPSSASYYQWRSTASSMSEDDNGDTYAALGGLFDKIATNTTTTITATTTHSEESLKRARKEAEKSDEYYRLTVKRLDQMRMAIEEAMFAHLNEMEQLELNRITQLKLLMSAFISCLSASLPQDKIVIDDMMVFLESLKADQDIKYIIQQYAVSGFNPKAILYDNYYHGIAHDQVFGVTLEDLAQQSATGIPKFVSVILQAIKKGSDEWDSERKLLLWSTPCPLDRVHTACMELNVATDRVSLDLFKKYEPGVLVAILRYFLLELPECLMTYELYDPVVTLFRGNNDVDVRITSLSNLCANLPSSHFKTLQAIIENISTWAKELSASGEVIQHISQSLGYIILKSRMDTHMTLNSKIPQRCIQDLILHSSDVFSETTRRLHHESEKRRMARPIVASKEDLIDNTKTKKGGSLMSFIKTSDDSKWSMMGVFQRNTTTNDTNNVHPTHIKISNEHYPATDIIVSPIVLSPTIPRGIPKYSAIMQNISPPSSPKALTPTAASISPEVMFDGDHIFNDESLVQSDDIQQEKKEETVEKKETKSHNIDSSFFDDDDDDE